MNQTPATAKGDILIIDDILENLDLLFTMLVEQGYEVRRVLSGEQALKVVEFDPPDLILLDIRMPDMDGYEVCQRLKAIPSRADIPVIFLSALNDALDKVKAFSVGGVDYITKPFYLEEVLSRIESQLSLYRQKLSLEAEIQHRRQVETTLRKINRKLNKEIKKRQQTQKKLRYANRQLELLATLDNLTQIANYRRFENYLEQEWYKLQREKMPLSLIMADIDYFKAYNDTYGHPQGNECLKEIAYVIDNTIKRAGDLVARYGGEEFAIVLSNTELEGAIQVAKQIQTAVYACHIPHQCSQVSDRITLSIGVANLIPAPSLKPQDLIKAADRALYRAKKTGRNQIISD